MEVLKKLNNNGSTIILVTHNLQLIKYCDRVLFMKDGNIEKEEILNVKI